MSRGNELMQAVGNRMIANGAKPIIEQLGPVTRANIDALLDAGRLEVAMSNGKWWRIRRNGATRRWKRDPARIYIPFKAGMYTYGAITESDFNGAAGSLYANSGYRIAP